MVLRNSSIGDFLWRRMIALSVIDLPAPERSGSAHASGSDPHRILLFGEGPVTGVGLIDHELGLAGHLARALPGLTRRGADVHVVARPAVSLYQAQAELAASALDVHDAVVLAVGAVDVARYASKAQWRSGLERLLDLVERRSTPTAQIVVVGIRNVIPGNEAGWPFVRTFRRHADRFNAVTREVVAARPRVGYVDLREEVEWRGAYAGWGESLAMHLGARLNAVSDGGAVARAARDMPQPEAARQLALDRMEILDTPVDSRIDTIVSLARTRYETEFAAVELIDRNRAWHKSAIGLPHGELPRNETFCNTTIARSGALVVGDARVDPRFRSLPMVRSGSIRFYAGYPIEAPDGSRIGTLCVADGQARSESEVDVTALRDLALMVQRRLRVPPVSSFWAPGGADKRSAAAGASTGETPIALIGV